MKNFFQNIQKLKSSKNFLFFFLLGVFFIFVFVSLIFPFLIRKYFRALPEKEYLEAIKRGHEACKTIKDKYYKDLCHYNFTLKEALQDEDPSICEKLKEGSPENFENCQNNYYFLIAKRTLDLGFCNEIKNRKVREVCLEEIKISQQLKEFLKK